MIESRAVRSIRSAMTQRTAKTTAKSKSKAPAKGKAKPKTREKAAAKGSGAPAGPRELGILGVETDDGFVMLGLLCAFSYKQELIRTWLQAYEELDRFNAIHGASARMARHAVIDRAITSGLLDGMRLMRYSPIIVHGILAHEAKGVPLGAEIVWQRGDDPPVVLPTGRHAGATDTALWLPDPGAKDFRRDGDRLVLDVDDSRLIAIREFVPESGLRHVEPNTWVPTGPIVESDTPPVLTTSDGRSYAYRFADDGRVELSPPPAPLPGLRSLQANPSSACIGPLVRGGSPVNIATAVPWSVTAFIEISGEDALKFRPRNLLADEVTLTHLAGA